MGCDHLRNRFRTTVKPFGRLLGLSPALDAVRVQLERAAQSDVPVLILGESGTGKEVAARALHAASPRARGPFVAVNLAALPATLIEDELFGHEAGAFTGAQAPRTGRFRRADGGTLFLDEVGDIPAPVQVKLLRALEEQSIEPLGSEQAQTVDVRVVAATHRDLRELVAKQQFRADLLFRLAVVPVTIPPLRERLEDVELLASHFAEREAQGSTPRQLSEAAVARLRAHPWPGNVRELENAVMRARVLATGERLEAEDFSFLGEGRPARAREIAALALRYGLTVPEVEQALFEEAIRLSHGNEAEAARRLGVSRRALDYRRGKTK